MTVATLLAVAQDQVTLKIESAHAAGAPEFPAYVAALLGAQLTGGNQYQVLDNGDEIFPAMLGAIAGAKRRVSFETYIFEEGTVGEQFVAAFESAARRGVQVNLVIDAIGATMPGDWTTRLEQAGARMARFGAPSWYSLEELNYRTHRKILVVDGAVGFTGGVGVADHWLGHAQDEDHWRDTMVRIEGPVARLMEGAFNENFVESLPGVAPTVDPPPLVPPSAGDAAMILRSSPTGGSSDMKRLYLLSIAAARRTLDIRTPYFIIDESSSYALTQAVNRGVRVRVLVEGDVTDAKPVKYASRSFYERLMAQGIEIHEYQPTMLHVKTMVVDAAWSLFGSANFDNRSLELNDEMNVAVGDAALAATFTRSFEQDLGRAKKLDLGAWRRRPALEKTREHFWSYFGEVF